MAIAGGALLLVAFVFLMPRDSVSGSAAHRNVKLGWFSIEQTPGYQREELSRKSTWIRRGIGFGSLALGVLFLLLGV